MRYEIAEQIQHSIQLIMAIVDSWESPNERDKRWNPIGSVILSLTGFVTEELRPIKQMLHTAQQQVYHANQIWRSGSSHFLASMKLQNERISNLNRLLTLQKQSMSELYTEIGELFVLTDNLSSAFAKAITKLKI